jgi:hypothetical protein
LPNGCSVYSHEILVHISAGKGARQRDHKSGNNQHLCFFHKSIFDFLKKCAYSISGFQHLLFLLQ